MDALLSLGIEADRAAAVKAELVERHREPQRRYHTNEHVGEVLAEAERLLGATPLADGPAVRLAAWFHDAVYDPTAASGANEEASAQLALARLGPDGCDLPPALVDEVARLVRLTVGHDVGDGDPSGAVLVDADLWILSSGRERYDRYAADVRAEHAPVDDEAWRAGRAAVLDRFLQAPLRYHAGSAADRAIRTAKATANLQCERAALDRAR